VEDMDEDLVQALNNALLNDEPVPPEADKAYKAAQYEWIEGRVRIVKAYYDKFLEEAAEEGLDPDYLQQIMVAEGRRGTGITAFGVDRTPTRFSPGLSEIYRLFEPDTENPWLQEED